MVYFVVGTKAQLIKVAPIMVALQNKRIGYNFIFTGQHRNTIDQLQKNFGIKDPDIVLYKGKDITSLMQIPFWAIRILLKTLLNKKEIFRSRDERDIVLVHGDTFSTLIGVLMAKIAGKKIGHLEAGLRSFDLFNPFPEEIVRLLTFHFSDVYYCPGNWALKNLKRYDGEKVDTGINTLYDSLQIAKGKINDIDVEIPDVKYVIVSLHRFENIFNRKRFHLLIIYLNKISKKIRLLFILHPPTEKKLKEYGFFEELMRNENIELRPRYDYFRFIKLLAGCEFVVTDGGSNQEESTYLGKPTILFRKATERREGIDANVVLSEYKWNIINEFIHNYQSYASHPGSPDKSPIAIILEHVSSYSQLELKECI